MFATPVPQHVVCCIPMGLHQNCIHDRAPVGGSLLSRPWFPAFHQPPILSSPVAGPAYIPPPPFALTQQSSPLLARAGGGRGENARVESSEERAARLADRRRERNRKSRRRKNTRKMHEFLRCAGLEEALRGPEEEEEEEEEAWSGGSSGGENDSNGVNVEVNTPSGQRVMLFPTARNTSRLLTAL